MHPVQIDRAHFQLPEKTDEIVFAKDQPNYIPLPSLRTPDGRVVTQWKLTTQEVEAIRKGQPLTLILHTFSSRCPNCGGPLGLTPVQLMVADQNEVINLRED